MPPTQTASSCAPVTGSPSQKLAVFTRYADEWSQTQLVREMASGRTIDQLLTTVQALPYHPDPPGLDLVCSVSDMVAYGGDCEDRAILFSALAAANGYRVQIVWDEQAGAPEDHVTCRLMLGGKWLWADPTVVGARIGEHPQDAARRTGQWERLQ